VPPDDFVHSSLRKLEALSLIQAKVKADGDLRYSIHPVIQMWGRVRLGDKKAQKMWSRKTVQLVDQAWKAIDGQESDFPSRIAPHLLEIVQSARVYGTAFPYTCIGLGSPQYPISRCGRTLQVLDTQNLTLGEINNDLAGWLVWISWILEEGWHRSQQFFLGHDCSGNDYLFLWCVYKFGELYQISGEWGDAYNLYYFIFQELLERYPDTHPRPLEVVGDMAWASLRRFLDNNEDDDDALQGIYDLYSWLLVARAKTLGKKHPATMGALMGQASVMMVKGDYSGALPLLRNAYDTRLKAKGPKDRLTKNAKAALLEALEAQRLWAEASLLRDSPDGAEVDITSTLDFADSLRHFLFNQEALKRYERGLGADVVQASLSRMAPGSATMVRANSSRLFHEAYWWRRNASRDPVGLRMAELRENEERLQEFYLSQKELVSSIYLPEQRAEDSLHLANEHFVNQRWKEALFWYQELVEGGTGNAQTLWSPFHYRNIAEVWQNLQQPAEAIRWYQYGLYITEDNGLHDELQWKNHERVAQILWDERDLNGAMEHFCRAMDLSRYDSDTTAWEGFNLSTISKLALELQDSHQYFDASILLRQYLKMQRRRLEVRPSQMGCEVAWAHEILAQHLIFMDREDLAVVELHKGLILVELFYGEDVFAASQLVSKLATIALGQENRLHNGICLNGFTPENSLKYYQRLIKWSYRSDDWSYDLYRHMMELGNLFESYELCEQANSIFLEALRWSSRLHDSSGLHDSGYYTLCHKYATFLLMHFGYTEEVEEWYDLAFSGPLNLSQEQVTGWSEWREQAKNSSLCSENDLRKYFSHFTCSFSSL
jgi:tetratricopeptide (TPR) repeat protein